MVSVAGPSRRALLSAAARSAPRAGRPAPTIGAIPSGSSPSSSAGPSAPPLIRRRGRRYATSSPAPASTAQLVKRLREMTGAPMMECKKALSSPEVDGDVERAREWLRKHGSAKASSKVAGREALEGLVGIRFSDGGDAASLVKVASETDFASRSEAFSDFVEEVASAAAAGRAEEVDDIPAFLATSKDAGGKPLDERLKDAILAIRENLRVDSVSVLRASPGSVLGGYVHGRTSPSSSCGTAAALVELKRTDNKRTENSEDAAKKLAMHVVAARPSYLDEASVPPDVVKKEMEILREKMAGNKKPPEIMEKILKGQMRKFYEGVCLTEQAHMVEEGGPKVSRALKELGLEVRAFRLAGTGGS